MDKKLPKIFANKIDKKIENNNTYYATDKKEVEEVEAKKNTYDIPISVEQKIKKIFNSTRYVYKADVLITTKNASFTKKIIGSSGGKLITIDNELIPIDDIIDIKFKDE